MQIVAEPFDCVRWHLTFHNVKQANAFFEEMKDRPELMDLHQQDHKVFFITKDKKLGRIIAKDFEGRLVSALKLQVKKSKEKTDEPQSQTAPLKDEASDRGGEETNSLDGETGKGTG